MIIDPMWRSPLLLGLFVALTALSSIQSALADDQAVGQVLSRSPDGTLYLRRLKADPGDLGEARKILEISTKEGRVIYRWISSIGPTVCLWSDDSAFLAVNDGPGDHGDELMVFGFSWHGGERRVVVLREANGKKIRNELEHRHGGFFSSIEKASIRGLEWRDGRLWCSVHGSLSLKRQPSLRVPFHELWVMSFPACGDPLIEEVWTRAYPSEKPVNQLQ